MHFRVLGINLLEMMAHKWHFEKWKQHGAGADAEASEAAGPQAAAADST